MVNAAASGEGLFHVLSRGVDKRKIFLDKKDYLRFIHDLFEFNDQTKSSNNYYHFHRQSNDIASRYINKKEKEEKKPRKLLVNIHAFCLMQNHYHLLLSPKDKDAIPLFMRKLNIGYAKYFNAKYERKGTLFEGRYKSVLVKSNSHFVYLPYYIHLNPLDLKFPEWRKGELSSYKKAIKFLENYRWSSHLDYLGRKNFPSVTQRELLMEYFGGFQGYKRGLYGWLKDLNLRSMESIQDIMLE